MLRHDARRDTITRLAALLHLDEQEVEAAAPRFEGLPGAAEMSGLAHLTARADERVKETSSHSTNGRVSTFLNWLWDFHTAFPHYRLLLTPGSPGEEAYAEATLSRVVEFIRIRGPKARSRDPRFTSARSIGDYASAFRAWLNLRRRKRAFVAGDMLTLRQQLKHCRKADWPSTQRVTQRALRARHFRLAAPRLDRSSAYGRLRWALGLAAHNCLCRGADLGLADDALPDPKRNVMISCVCWLPATATRTYPICVIWLVPTKDPEMKHPRVPVVIPRRSADAPFLSDPLCTYDAVLLLWRERTAAIPSHLRASVHFFALPDGRVVRTADCARMFQEIAAAAGEDGAAFGATSARAGGASDIRARYAGDLSRAISVVKRRGRWDTDIHQIYQREGISEQAEASAAVADVDAVDMEEVFTGWHQPRG